MSLKMTTKTESGFSRAALHYAINFQIPTTTYEITRFGFMPITTLTNEQNTGSSKRLQKTKIYDRVVAPLLLTVVHNLAIMNSWPSIHECKYTPMYGIFLCIDTYACKNIHIHTRTQDMQLDP